MNRFFFPAFYDRYIKDNENEWYLKNEIPTLGDCRGKMVLMRRCKVFPWWKKGESCGLDFSRWPDQSSKRKTGHKKNTKRIKKRKIGQVGGLLKEKI